MHRHVRITVAALAVAGLLACGGDDSSDESSPPSTPPPGSAGVSTTTTGTDTTDPAATTSTSAEGTPGDGVATGDVCTADRVGGELTMGVYSETAGLDPTVSTGGAVTGATELVALYDTLMQYDEEAGEWVPRLAESLVPNDDATEWTLTLRDGITFGNGDPMDAAAVKASIERHQADTTTIRSRGLSSDITAMATPDARTVVFTLAKPWGSFPYLLSGEVGMIVNPAVVDQLGADAFNALPVGGGAGPYEPVSFVPGEELVLEAKADYWDGPVCIQRLRFVVVPGGEATLDAFEAGELDVAYLREAGVIARSREAGYSEHAELLNAGAALLVNSGAGSGTPPLADVRLRRAVAAAIDAVQVDLRAYDGVGLPTSAVVHPDSRFYEGIEGPVHDPELAAQLVAEVKGEGEWDGTITLACDNTRTDETLAIESQLEAVGFDVDADASASVGAKIQRVIVDHEYDLGCWGLNLVEASPWAGLARSVESSAASGRTGYADADMDAALDALKAASTRDEQQAALADVQAVWNETIPAVITSAIEELVVWRDGVHGLDFNQETVTIFNDAYLDG